MSEPRPDDAMLEIGDIDEEPTPSPSPEPPPKVVIEYRDRGIPWMLVPPMLALSAVIAAVVVYNVVAKRDARRPAVSTVDLEPQVHLPDGPKPEEPPPPTPAVTNSASVENPPTPTKDPEPAKRVEVPPSLIAAPAAPGSTLDKVAATAPEPPSNPPGRDPAPVGFDPALIATQPPPLDPASAAPPVDRDLAAAGRMGRPDDPASGLNPPAQPDQVDPDLLPPDPRKARFDRRRRAIEARRRAEADRFQFHAELAAITKKYGRKAAPAIHKLAQDYEQEIPAASLEQAHKALGDKGMYAGANTSERINLLRKLGFPETAVLGDIFDLEGRYESKGARNARTKDEIYVQSALILLNHPPNRLSTSARPVSVPKANFRSGPESPNSADSILSDSNP